MKALQPTSQHNEAVHSLYEALRDKIGNRSTEDQLTTTAQVGS